MRQLAVALVALVAIAACDYPTTPPPGGEDAPVPDANVDADSALVDAADGAPDAPDAGCVEGTRQCEGNTIMECEGGTWTAGVTCSNLCALGGCVTPPSCSGGVTTCGPTASESCCRSLPVPGGEFARSYDGVSSGATDDRFRATVSTFHLDRYEVSVTRFQAFVAAYPGSKPTEGTGRNPNDPSDPGWRSAWSPSLPVTQMDLMNALACEGVTSQISTHPVRCVSWYAAQAFCIWDGGRLPTEAEWNYAAAGGDQQRVYPWSSPSSSTVISSSHAVYGVSGPSHPGSKAAGDGRYGHSDLGGNVWEWVFDSYTEPYPTETCDDCATHTAAQYRGNRGGSFANVAANLIASLRGALDPALTRSSIGFRCARNPPP